MTTGTTGTSLTPQIQVTKQKLADNDVLGIVLLVLFNVLLAVILVALIYVGLICVRRKRARIATVEILEVKEELIVDRTGS